MFNMRQVGRESGDLRAMASSMLVQKTVELKTQWENVHTLVEPQTKADGTHVWAFPPLFPLDVRFFAFGRQRSIRLRRHDYFELLYVFSGRASYQVQDREFALEEGDLVVINGLYYHRLSEIQSNSFRAVVLYFRPEVLQGTDTTGEKALYLMLFLPPPGGALSPCRPPLNRLAVKNLSPLCQYSQATARRNHSRSSCGPNSS
jgi:mannose-6-phosphate isomerase-like protein (cupin superfamily)